MNSLTLYMSLRSPFARRVRLLLEELGLSYETRVVDVFNPPADLLVANPLGRVPALVLPTGQALIESWEIIGYLKERHGSHPLFLTHGADEVRLRNISGLAVGMMEHCVMVVLEGMRPIGLRSPEWRQDAIDAVERSLTALSAERGHPYIAGGELTMGDLDLGAALAYCDLRLGPALVDRHPELRAYLARLNSRPSFQKTVPPA